MSNFLSQFGPITLMLLGAVLSIGGAIWAQLQNDRQQSEIIRLNRHITEAVTGGDSYPVVSPVFLARHGEQGDIRRLSLMHSGKYPVYDLVLRVTDVAKLRALSKKGGYFSQNEYMWQFHIGTIGRGYENVFMDIPLQESERMEFSFTFLARNGQFNQRAIYQKTKGVWHTALRIEKDGKLVYENIDNGFPDTLVGELAKPIL
jgi:hypothetical protein